VTKTKWRRVLQRRPIAGLIVIAPLTATAWVLRWIFQALDGIIGQSIYRAIGAATGRERLVVPGLGLIALLLLLFGAGWLTERAIGSRLIAWWNDLLERLPVVRRIYGTSNRIVRSLLGSESKSFSTVVVLEWPSPGRWSIGFLTGQVPGEVREHAGDSVCVFVPTTPNPTTGFLIMIPREQVRPLQMTVDEAFTFILSAGSVSPEVQPPAPAAVP
jgi:uncharacterized membrane protein